MPGRRHDGVRAVLHAHPELSSWALATFMGAELPDMPWTIGDNEANTRPSRDFHSDVVTIGGQPQEPACLVINEFETTLSERKLERCVEYAAAWWLYHSKPPAGVHVVVFTPDPRADEYRRTVSVRCGALTLTVELCIVGPNQIPKLETAGQVATDPSVAALSVMAHGHLDGTCELFLGGLQGVGDPEYAMRYIDYALEMVEGAAKSNLEVLLSMSTDNEVVSEFKRTQQAIGEAIGEAKGKAQAALQILERRGLKVSADMWARADACADLEQAERWFKRSFDVERAEDLLD
ncbi:hypothetical protein AB0J52_04355 [Spirillospora sp. NPDC049652]